MMTLTIDKRLVCKRFGKRLDSYDRHAEVQRSMAERLVGYLLDASRHSAPRTLEIGCGAGTLTRLLLDRLAVEELFANDLIPDCRGVVESLARTRPGTAIRFFEGDIEQLADLPQALDLVVSNATLHWLEDMSGLLPRLRASLRPGGCLAFSTFGPENLREIRALTGHGLPYASCSEIESLLPEHFRVLVCREERIALSFASPREVLRHLQLTGANALTRERWTRRALNEFVRRYRNDWGRDGRVPLTYHPMFFVAEAG